MAIQHPAGIATQPISDLKDFDVRSGNSLERLIFNHRRLMVCACLLITILLGTYAARLGINANFENLIPQTHPYIQNFLENKEDLRALGNSLRVVVETQEGDIYDPEYLEVLKNVNDTLFLIPGVNRPFVKSLWMPLVRWTEVTEEGFRGGPVMPADVVGFAVLAAIDIPVIRSLALAASIGVLVLVFTNLILLPVLLSYFGVGIEAARAALKEEQAQSHGSGLGLLWSRLEAFTRPTGAAIAIIAGAALAAGAYVIAQDLQIGDLDAGAPELRAQSRYNLDSAYINKHYGLSGDQFAVVVKTDPGGCEQYGTIVEIDRLGETLRRLPSVQAVASLADSVASTTSAMFEASPKWLTISHSQALVSTAVYRARDANRDLHNEDCTIVPVVAYLTDHKAHSLDQVLATVEQFAREHDTPGLQFLPVAGSAGIEAVTNIVVRESNLKMMLYVYGAVVLLCLITFRSWRAVLVAVLPLLVTSIMCEALMVMLGIGMKVSTLPVIALGVGIGVDYALYLLSVQLNLMRAGQTLAQAYRGALQFTGRVVALVGVTLAAGVVTWAFSPIKFQADMGILLTFMFLWNMASALILIPALSLVFLNKKL